ncbi:MAG: hypothetical protein V8S93_11100 [Lachnospiraceae bacterium]
MDPGAAQEEKAHYKTADHDRQCGDLHRPDRRSDPAFFRRKEPWKREETESSAIEESTFQASDISVNGISLKGMTRSEAKAAIEKEYPWKVTITYNGESIDAENLIDSDLDAFLDGICTGKAEAENIPSRLKTLRICSPLRQRQRRTRRRSGM